MAAAPPLVLVKVGGGEWRRFGAGSLDMDATALLRGLLADAIFSTDLAGVKLGACVVSVAADASKAKPPPGAPSLPLEGGEELRDVTARLGADPSHAVFVHVLPPAAAGDGDGESVRREALRVVLNRSLVGADSRSLVYRLDSSSHPTRPSNAQRQAPFSPC